jgi:hypothetical protein
MNLHTAGGRYWADASIWDNGNDNVDYAVAITKIGGRPDDDGWFGFMPVVDVAESPRWPCTGPSIVSVPVEFAWVGPSGHVTVQTEVVSGRVC